MDNYRVLLIEDQDTTRQRLKQIVNQHENLEIINDVDCCAAAIPLIDESQPDVMLVDLGLPDGSGLDLIKHARKTSPKTEIMVITVFGDERHVISAIENGASGYLLKDGDPEYIGDAIIQMVNGGSPISASIARYLLRRFNKEPTQDIQDENLPKLTKREQEVLELVAKGFTYAEIADTLSMSIHTVTSHIKHIYKKLSVNSRGEAVFEAMQLGLIDK